MTWVKGIREGKGTWDLRLGPLPPGSAFSSAQMWASTAAATSCSHHHAYHTMMDCISLIREPKPSFSPLNCFSQVFYQSNEKETNTVRLHKNRPYLSFISFQNVYVQARLVIRNYFMCNYIQTQRFITQASLSSQACDLSYLGGWGRRISKSRSRPALDTE